MIHTFELLRFVLPNDSALTAWATLSRPPPDSGITIQKPRISKARDSPIIYGYYLRLQVDCLRMFQVCNLTPDLFPHIIANINMVLADIGLSVDDFVLSRIDYCFNAVVEDPEARRLLFQIFNEKAPTYAQYLFRSPGQYDTTIRSSTKKNTTRTIQVYDKEAERRSKGRAVQTWEAGVVRTEVQVRREHIKQRVKSQHITRNLRDWLTEDQYRHFMPQAWRFLCNKGDFYTLPEAKAIVEASSYTPTIKGRLSAFLETVATNDMDTAQAALSKNTALAYIDKLDKLGVNPITLPNDNKYSTIPSPFRFF